MKLSDTVSSSLPGAMNKTTSRLADATKRLSTGYRINQAADDAAGLAVSEKLRAIDRGLRQGSRNITDGIDYLNTVEGASAAINDMLHRMKELAVESANGSYSDMERAAMNLEYRQLVQETKQITELADFNGIPLFEEHQACFGTLKGVVEHGAVIEINSDNDQLLLGVIRDGEQTTTTVDIPHGSYGFYEFLDMMDSRLQDTDSGFFIGTDDMGKLTLDYEGGMLNYICGTGASLFYEVDPGSSQGYLLGVTRFPTATSAIRLVADATDAEGNLIPGNNTISFRIGNLDDTVYSIEIPPSGNNYYTRDMLVDIMNGLFREKFENGEMPKLVEAVAGTNAAGEGIIGLQCEQNITGLTGNFIYIDDIGKTKQSPIYDIRRDNTLQNKPATLTATKLLSNNIRIEKGRNDYFNLQVSYYTGENASTTKTIKINLLDEGEYTREYATPDLLAERIQQQIDSYDVPFKVSVLDNGAGKSLYFESTMYGERCNIKLDKSRVPSGHMVYDLFDAGTLRPVSPNPASSIYTAASFTGSLMLGDDVTIPEGHNELSLSVTMDNMGESPTVTHNVNITIDAGTYSTPQLLVLLRNKISENSPAGVDLTDYINVGLTGTNKLTLTANNTAGRNVKSISVSSQSSAYSRLIAGVGYTNSANSVPGSTNRYYSYSGTMPGGGSTISSTAGYTTDGNSYTTGTNTSTPQTRTTYITHPTVPFSSMARNPGQTIYPPEYDDLAPDLGLIQYTPATLTMSNVLTQFSETTNARGQSVSASPLTLSLSIAGVTGTAPSVTIPAGLTAAEAVAYLNDPANGLSGFVTASRNGNDLTFTTIARGEGVNFTGAQGTLCRRLNRANLGTGQVIDLPNNIVYLPAKAEFGSAGTNFPPDTAKTFAFTACGRNYEMNVAAGTTFSQFITQLNQKISETDGGNPRLTATSSGNKLILTMNTHDSAGSTITLNSARNSLPVNMTFVRGNGPDEYRGADGQFYYPPTATISSVSSNLPITLNRGGNDTVSMNLSGQNITINILPDGTDTATYTSTSTLATAIQNAIDRDPTLAGKLNVTSTSSSIKFTGTTGGDGTSISNLRTGFGAEQYRTSASTTSGGQTGTVDLAANTISFPGYLQNANFGTLFSASPNSRVEINDSNNVISLNVNGTNYTRTMATGDYTRAQLYNELVQALQGAPVTISPSSSNTLTISTTDAGTGASVTVDSANTSPFFMRATNSGAASSSARRDTRCAITGKMSANNYTVDGFNTMSFNVTTEGTTHTVNITVPGGPAPAAARTYSAAQLAAAINDSLNSPANGIAGLLKCTANSNGTLTIKANVITNSCTLSGFDGPLFERLFQDPSYTNTIAHSEVKGSSTGTMASYILGRTKLLPRSMEEINSKSDVVITAGLNDRLTFDFTVGDDVHTIDVSFDEGNYSADQIARRIEEVGRKAISEMNIDGVDAKYFHVSLGLAAIGVEEPNLTESSENRLVLSYLHPDDGSISKLPIRIDGIRGNSAYRIFYEASDYPRPSYILGSADLSNGINIERGINNEFNVKISGQRASVTIPEGYYTCKQLADYLTSQYDKMGVNLRAVDKEGKLMLYSVENGRYIFEEISGNGAGDIFYGGTMRRDENMNIGIHTGRRTGSYIFYDKAQVGVNSLRLNASSIATAQLASKAINTIDLATNYLVMWRSRAGAEQNRSERTLARNETTSLNLENADATLRDADMAQAAIDLAKQQILQQVQQYMAGKEKEVQNSVLNTLA